MKALILAGGRGTRLIPLTHTKNKHLLPIGNEPMIFRVIKDVINAGVEDIIINQNKGDDSVKEEIESRDWNANIQYIAQEEPNGMMYPIVMARKELEGEPFMLIAGDNVLSGGLQSHIEQFEKNKSDAHLLVTRVVNPQQFGVAVTDGDQLLRTVEKPKKFVSDLAVTGIYIYRDPIFLAMDDVKPIDPKGGGRKEYYPPPAHQWLVDHGYQVTVSEVTGWWKDTGDPHDLLLANRLVLERDNNYEKKGHFHESQVEGKVESKEGSRIINSIIRGPVSIGMNCVIENSYIGPFTSVGDESRIENANIENSIIMYRGYVHDLKTRLDSCLLGWNAEVTQSDPIMGSTSSVFIGDDSRVKIG